MRRVEGNRDKVEEQSRGKAGCRLSICLWSTGPLLRYHHKHIHASKVTSWSILATKSPTFQVINGLLKLGYWSLSELSASLSLYAETDLWVSPSDAAPDPDWSRPCETLPPSACRWGPWSPPRTCPPSVSTIGWKTVICVKQESDSMSTHCLCMWHCLGCGSGSSLLLPFSLKGGWERGQTEGCSYLLSLGLQWLQVVGHSFQLFLKLRAFAGVLVRGSSFRGRGRRGERKRREARVDRTRCRNKTGRKK